MDAVSKIASQLGENEPKAIKRITQIVKGLGAKRASELGAKAVEIEAGEGMWFKWSGKKRRRTLGGCFFRLSKDSLSAEERIIVFGAPAQDVALLRPLKWEERLELLKRAAKSQTQVGKAVTVKIVVVGKPSQVLEQPGASAVLALLTHTDASPCLPKGLPKPQSKPTRYAVYISGKQWRKVADKLKDPADALVIEGFPVFDKAFEGITVMATSTSTKKLKAEQAAKLKAAD